MFLQPGGPCVHMCSIPAGKGCCRLGLTLLSPGGREGTANAAAQPLTTVLLLCTLLHLIPSGFHPQLKFSMQHSACLSVTETGCGQIQKRSTQGPANDHSPVSGSASPHLVPLNPELLWKRIFHQSKHLALGTHGIILAILLKNGVHLSVGPGPHCRDSRVAWTDKIPDTLQGL